MHEDSNLIISVGIVALNEEKFLPLILSDLEKQNYPHQYMELLLIDSKSSDKTKRIMEEFQRNHPNFYDVQVIENSKITQSCGWNIAIDRFQGDALVRIDAHARIANDFIFQNVNCLKNGEKVVGGRRDTISLNENEWSNVLLIAENSLFGSSIASYRRGNETGKYVKSMFHACYTKEVLSDVGHFNEFLGRTEDNEFHYRIRELGYQLYYSPNIFSSQYIRLDFKKMLKQKYANGYWIGITTYIAPKCLSLYHYVPFVFVLSCLIVLFISIRWYPIYISLLFCVYFLFMILNTILSVGKNWNFRHMTLPFIFFMLHMSYGIGTIIGLIDIKKLKDYKTGEEKKGGSANEFKS